MKKHSLLLSAITFSLFALQLFAATGVNADNSQKQESPKYSHGVLIRFEGPIDQRLEAYFNRKIDQAISEGADLVILEIDSPGGGLAETIEMADRLRDLDSVHTVAYIPKQAISGAAIMAISCDDIIMSPKALIGDAGPIFLDERSLFRHAPEKIVSHLANVVRGYASAKNRPPALAEAMVDRKLQVFQVKNKETGKLTCMSQKEIDADTNPDQWEIVRPVPNTGNDRFLELDGQAAVDFGLAQGPADSREELLNRYKPAGEVTILEPSGVDSFVYILYNPIIIGILIIIGLVGLYIEFMAPGTGIGGLIAGSCFALFFWSHILGGTANWLDVMLFTVGVLCLIAELFIIPGFGIVGMTGLILILVSLIMACQSFLIPRNNRELMQLTTTMLILFGSGGGFLLAAYYISNRFGSLPIFNKMILVPPDPVHGFKGQTAETSNEIIALAKESTPTVNVGDIGIAQSALRPAGKARFGVTIIDVVTDGDFISQGRRIEVIEHSGARIIVREVE